MVQSIALATPSLGNVSIWWSRLCMSIIWPMNRGQTIFYLRDKVGGEVAECRNAIVDSVLAYDRVSGPISHIFWVDDDVLVFPGCLLELLHQNKDICSGVYFTKREGNLAEPLIFPLDSDPRTGFYPNEVYEVAGHGMGLTLVRTQVYKDLAAKQLTTMDKYGRPEWYNTSKDGTDVSQDEKDVISLGHTEDTDFCGKARKLGYKCYIDTNAHAFGFHYDKEKDKGYPEATWIAWIRGNPIIWETPDGIITWN